MALTAPHFVCPASFGMGHTTCRFTLWQSGFGKVLCFKSISQWYLTTILVHCIYTTTKTNEQQICYCQSQHPQRSCIISTNSDTMIRLIHMISILILQQRSTTHESLWPTSCLNELDRFFLLFWSILQNLIRFKMLTTGHPCLLDISSTSLKYNGISFQFFFNFQYPKQFITSLPCHENSCFPLFPVQPLVFNVYFIYFFIYGHKGLFPLNSHTKYCSLLCLIWKILFEFECLSVMSETCRCACTLEQGFRILIFGAENMVKLFFFVCQYQSSWKHAMKISNTM